MKVLIIFLGLCEDTSPAVLSIAQLLRFNSRRMLGKSLSVNRHTAALGTPLLTYIELTHTGKKELEPALSSGYKY